MTVTPQHMAALQDADNTRRERYRCRQDVGAGRMTVAAALNHPSCQTARVIDVLAWQRYWAGYRSERFLLENRICSPFMVAKNLTERQRVLIAKALRLSERQAAA